MNSNDNSAMRSFKRSNLSRDAGFAILALLAVATTSIIGQIATYPNLAPWYAALNKPVFNPPNWVFAPVWTVLYVLMALSLWRILRLSSATNGRTIALILFVILIVLNAAWSWMFFGANSPLLGLVNIVPQFLIILATIVASHRLDSIAAWCLTPLAIWVAYAGVLNAAIWILNG